MEPTGLTAILNLLRLAYDWVILDLGHWLDELAAAALLEADTVLMVTELIVPHLRNFRKWRRFMLDRGLDRERLQVVVNRYNKASEVRLQDLEGILERPVLATLPSDYLPLAAAINQGRPLARSGPPLQAAAESDRSGPGIYTLRLAAKRPNRAGAFSFFNRGDMWVG